MSTARAQLRREFEAVRLVLLEVWNPVGAHGLPRDEYDAYAWPIVRLLREGASDEALLTYLHATERAYFGRQVDVAQLAPVIAALRATGIGSDKELEQ